MLPYYHKDIVFQDSIQRLEGMEAFSAMTARLAKRSRKLEYVVHSGLMEGDLIFMEWEMIIAYQRFPSSSVYGASRLRLKDGKIVYQRDYYDLWGDIYDNIPLVRRLYRWFMRRSFG